MAIFSETIIARIEITKFRANKYCFIKIRVAFMCLNLFFEWGVANLYETFGSFFFIVVSRREIAVMLRVVKTCRCIDLHRRLSSCTSRPADARPLEPAYYSILQTYAHTANASIVSDELLLEPHALKCKLHHMLWKLHTIKRESSRITNPNILI